MVGEIREKADELKDRVCIGRAAGLKLGIEVVGGRLRLFARAARGRGYNLPRELEVAPMATRDAPSEVVPARRPPAGKLTFEEFHDWLDEDTWAEWVDGEVQMVSPANLRHQELGFFLSRIVGAWVEAHDLGVVLPPPFVMRMPPPVDQAREPDLLFIARTHLDRLKPTYLDGPADLVVEIVSPDSLARDRGEKYAEYERAGVPEYWLLDQDRRWAEFYQLGPDERYRTVFAGSSGTDESRALDGLKLPVEWLWQEPLPKVAEALRTLDVFG